MHVHGLQDRRHVHLHPFDIVRTPFFVLARYHRQSVSVDCFSCARSQVFVCVEKNNPGTQCLHMVSSPRNSRNSGKFCKVCPFNLHETWQLFLAWKMSATDHALCGRWWRSDKGNKLFLYGNYPCIRLFQVNVMACDWPAFLLKFTNRVEWSDTVIVRATLFLTSKPPEGVSQAV